MGSNGSAKLGLIVLKSCEKLGGMINRHIKQLRGEEDIDGRCIAFGRKQK